MGNWVSADWLSGVLNQHAAALELFAAQWSDTPEDCVQEAIIDLVRQPACPNNTAAWLFHAVRMRAINACRSTTRRRRHEALAARLMKLETESATDPGFDTAELAEALAQLNDELREVVVARIWGGLGFAEIAELQGQSTSTTYRRFQSGLAALRAILEGTCHTIVPASRPDTKNDLIREDT